MNRMNQVLVGILALQLVLAGIVFWPGSSAGQTGGASLFPGLEAANIVGIIITDGEGQSLHLARRDAGWVLPEADDFPALGEPVNTLLGKVVGLRADRPVTQTPNSHKRLEVAEDQFQRLIILELDDGGVHQLYIGSSPSFRATHVRSGSQDAVFLTSDLSASDVAAEASAWVDRVYVEIPQDEIVALTLENNQGTFELLKAGEGTWTMSGLGVGETLDQGVVSRLISRAARVTLVEPLGRSDEDAPGLEEPLALVTIVSTSEAEGEQRYELRVGSKRDSDNSYVMAYSESPYYVWVSEFAVRELVEYDREDFLVPPAAPTPSTEATPEAP